MAFVKSLSARNPIEQKTVQHLAKAYLIESWLSSDLCESSLLNMCSNDRRKMCPKRTHEMQLPNLEIHAVAAYVNELLKIRNCNMFVFSPVGRLARADQSKPMANNSEQLRVRLQILVGIKTESNTQKVVRREAPKGQ